MKINQIVNEGVAEGLPQTLRKVVPGYAKREIDKKMDAGKFGKTDADKDANFQRYKKIQDKLKEQGVAEGHADQQRKIVKQGGKPVGEIGIDRESSTGNGQWYMKHYASGIDNVGYDSMEEALAELKHCLKQDVAEGKNNNGVEVGNIQPGDTITWWYNRAHPNYQGTVREVRGSTLIVYAPGSGSMYQLSKDDIRSHKKQGVVEGDTDPADDAEKSQQKYASDTAAMAQGEIANKMPRMLPGDREDPKMGMQESLSRIQNLAGLK